MITLDGKTVPGPVVVGSCRGVRHRNPVRQRTFRAAIGGSLVSYISMTACTPVVSVHAAAPSRATRRTLFDG
jgi:hypothetical protein